MLEFGWEDGILTVRVNTILDLLHTRDQLVPHRIQPKFSHLALFDERTMFPLPLPSCGTHTIPTSNFFRGHILLVKIGSRDGGNRGLLVSCLDGGRVETGLSVAFAFSALPLRRLLSLRSLAGGFVLAHSLPGRGGGGGGEVAGVYVGSLVHTVGKSVFSDMMDVTVSVMPLV